MQPRTSIKDITFFRSQIELHSRMQKRAEENMANGLIASDRIQASKRFRFSQNLNCLILKYSAGEALENIEKDLLLVLAQAAEIWPDDGSESMPDFLKDWYGKMLWMLTLGIFLNISDEDFDKILTVWDKTDRRDWLIDYLISSRIPSRPKVDTLIFPKPYATMKKAVEETDPQKRSAIVKHYLEKEWYPGHKGLYWYDNHKSHHDTFFGYWSFEAAAVVKIAGIDDSSFRDNQYYPKDLL